MTETTRFLEAIAEEPSDTDLRLIYADWLEERNDPRAEFIRVQCQLDDEATPRDRLHELRTREYQLQQAHVQDWLGPLSELAGQWCFRRGMLEEIHLDAKVFLERHATLMSRHPLRCLSLENSDEHLEALVELPEFGRLEVLRLWDNGLGAGALRVLLESKHLDNLQGLDLSSNHIGREGASLLAKSKALAKLRMLRIDDNAIGPHGAEALANSIVLTNLRHLSLKDNRIRTLGAQMLSASKDLRLHSLVLDGNEIEMAGVQVLISAAVCRELREFRIARNPLGIGQFNTSAQPMPELETLDFESCKLAHWIGRGLNAMHWSKLRKLNLARNNIGRNGVRDLMGAECLRGVTALNLTGNEIGDEGVESLAASTNLQQVRELGLAANGLRGFAVRHLVDSKTLGSLEAVDLNGNQLGELGADILARSAWLGKLTRLSLRNNHIDDEGLGHLLESPHTENLRSLDLSYNDITNEGMKGLVRSALWTRLEELDVSSNEATRKPTAKQLAKGPRSFIF